MIRVHSRRIFVAGSAAVASAIAFTPARTLAQGTKIRIAGVLSDPLGEPFFAGEAGAFRRAGFDIDVTNLQNAGAVVAAVGGGSLEMGIGDLVSGVRALEAGVPILLLAGSGMYVSSDGSVILAAAKDSPIRGPRDLVGKTVAVPTLVGLTTVSLYAWLGQNGVDRATVKFVEVPQPAIAAGIQRGTIDAGILGEPFITPNRNDVRDIGHPYDAIAKEFPISVWYGSKAWIDADRERARRVVAAIYETARWCNTHRAETFAILVRDAHFDGDKLRGMIRTPFATALTPAMVQPVLNIATQNKIFDHPIDANAIITKL
jgi:NitT/TauT family transport system substrate-binding protein